MPLLSRSEQANPDIRNALTIDVSSDGEYVAFAGWTRVMIYDAHTGRHVRTIRTFNLDDGMYVSSLAFDPSHSHELVLVGLRIAGGGLARRVDVTTGEILSTIGIDADTYRIRFLPGQNAWLETTYGFYGKVRIRDAQSGVVRSTFATGSSSIVTASAITSEGRASWGQNDSLFQYDPVTGNVRLLARAHYPISRIMYTHDGGQIIAATIGLERFDATSGAFVDSIRLTSNINTMVLSSDGSSVLMNQGLGLQERKVSDFSLIRSWTPGGLPQEASSTVGAYFVANSAGALFRLMQDNSTPVCLTDHAGPTNSVVFEAAGDRMVTCGSDEVINSWNLTSGALVKRYRGSAGQTFSHVAASGRYIAASSNASADSSLVIWDIESGAIVTAIQPVAGSQQLLLVGDTLAVAGLDGSITLYDIAKGRLERQLPRLLSAANALQFSSRQRLLSYSDHYSTVAYSLANASNRMIPHGGTVLGVCDDSLLFSYESQFLWTSLQDSTGNSFEHAFSLHAPDSVLNQGPVAWNPDRHQIFMASGPRPGVTMYGFRMNYEYIGSTFIGVNVYDSVLKRISMEVAPTAIVISDDGSSLATVRSDGGVAVYSVGGPRAVESTKSGSRNVALVYPNPCRDQLWIDANAHAGNYIIYDALGRVARANGRVDDTGAVEIGDLRPGAYVLVVTSGKSTETTKFYKL